MSAETLADILAEMRHCIELASPRQRYAPEISLRAWLNLADRIEAAAKRDAAIHALTCEANERLREHLEIALRPSGNASALREALESISENLAMHVRCGRFVAPGDHVSFPISEAEAYIRDIRAALSAPPRNCDVGTRRFIVEAREALGEGGQCHG